MILGGMFSAILYKKKKKLMYIPYDTEKLNN